MPSITREHKLLWFKCSLSPQISLGESLFLKAAVWRGGLGGTGMGHVGGVLLEERTGEQARWSGARSSSRCGPACPVAFDRELQQFQVLAECHPSVLDSQPLEGESQNQLLPVWSILCAL